MVQETTTIEVVKAEVKEDLVSKLNKGYLFNVTITNDLAI